MQKNTALIVYATVHGQAELVARRIAEAAPEWQLHATVQDVRKTSAADLGQYGAIILVASVHYGRHQRSMARFVTRNRERLSRMHSAFISVSGDAGAPATRPRAEEYVREFFRVTGWTAAEHLVAAGAVKFTKYNFLQRYMTRRAFAEKGLQLDPRRDYEYTDWESVMRFAKAFLLSERDVRVA
ncbi:MAG TPA: flavodoxin domain-containing protein [Thermoanaerobaculia bacterium]